jgi:hypothetical protein
LLLGRALIANENPDFEMASNASARPDGLDGLRPNPNYSSRAPSACLAKQSGGPVIMMTAEQYEESLRRLNLAVYLFGERIGNPVDHPMIRPSMQAVAKPMPWPDGRSTARS